MLAKKTPEFFDKIKAGKFTLNLPLPRVEKVKNIRTVHQQTTCVSHLRGRMLQTPLKGSLLCERVGPVQGSKSPKSGKEGFPAKSKRGREEGDGTENVINCRDVCRKLS